MSTAALALPILAQPSNPLEAPIGPDPMLLDRIILQNQYGKSNGSESKGNGTNGQDAEPETSSAINFEPVLPEKSNGPKPSSVLSVILGKAQAPSPTETGSSSASDLLSMIKGLDMPQAQNEEAPPQPQAQADSAFSPAGQSQSPEGQNPANDYQPEVQKAEEFIPQAAPADQTLQSNFETKESPAFVSQTPQASDSASTGEFLSQPAAQNPLVEQLFGTQPETQPGTPIDAQAVSEPKPIAAESAPPQEKAEAAPARSDFFASNDFFSAAPPSQPAPQAEPEAQTFTEEPSPKPDPPVLAQPQVSNSFPTAGERPLSSLPPQELSYERSDRGNRTNKTETDETLAAKKALHEEVGILARRARNKQASEQAKHEPKPESSGPLSLLSGEIELFGKNIPKTFAAGLAALIVLIAIPVFFAIIGAIGQGIAGMVANQQAQNLPSLSGKWEFAYRFGQSVYRGQLLMQQRGQDIIGKGRDQQDFVISGKFNPPNITFGKQYVVDGQPAGKPVYWQGKVAFQPNQPPFIQGSYSTQLAKGVFLTRRVIEISGQWEARMLEPAQGNLGLDDTGMSRTILPDAPTGDAKIKQTQEFFLKIALGICGVCVLLALGSLKLFGPSGLIAIWNKKEYIPSQFRSQHGKMLSELGKKAMPGGMPLGHRLDWGIHQFHLPRSLALPAKVREANPHVLVIGAGGKGKSRLIANMIAQDIEAGDRSVIVVDSNGALVDLLVDWIASNPKGKEMAARTILLDPTNKEYCPAYNPLEPPEDGDLQGAASSIVHGFKAIYTEPPGSQSQWNEQTANILRSAVLLLMANNRTLIDLPTLLSDNDFRDIMLEKVERQKQERVEYITLIETWGQYKRLARTDQWINWVEPILNRVSPMLSDPRIRPILTKPQGDLILSDILKEKKILLCRVPQSDAKLLGSLLVTGFNQQALSQSRLSSAQAPCEIYLDEFDGFIEKKTFESMTSDTRKSKIGLIVSCKTMQHLPEDFRNHLVIHVGTMFAFSLAKKDADLLGPQMFRVDGRKIKHQTIQNIFNKVNSTPQFELISDEEKLNIDRLVGQEERTFFCYRIGTVAGVFHMKAPEFADIPESKVDWSLVEQMYGKTARG